MQLERLGIKIVAAFGLLISEPSSLSAAPNLDQLDYKTLRALVEAEQLASIDALLGLLPLEFRASYTLMHKSRSLQEASPLEPRVIMFNRDASFVLTFNGSPAQRGGAKLEMMQFDATERAFTFYEISFPEGDATKQLIFSEKNPRACVACHQSDPRPNWEPYFAWPGAYGSEDDSVLEGSQEWNGLRAFLDVYAQKPRYRHLVGLENRYVPGAKAPSRLLQGQELEVFFMQPNQVLMSKLFKLNVQRLGRILFEQAAYSRSKFLIASVLTGCLPTFRDEEPNPSVPEEEYARLRALDPRLAVLQEPTFDPSSAPAIFKDSVFLAGYAGRLYQANRLLDLGLKINLANWSTSFFGSKIESLGGAAASPFNDGSSGLDVSRLIVGTALAKIDPDFVGLDAFICDDRSVQINGTLTYTQKFCPDLAARRAELEAQYGFYKADGQAMSCQIIARRWLDSLL